jgi:adenine deaminase
VVVGTDEKDMACATNRIIELQGGLILANNGEILAEVPLQIGGYLALGSAKRVKEDFNKFNKVARELGLIWSNPYLTLQTLPGPILPFFRICFQGFFEFKNRRVVELIIG